MRTLTLAFLLTALSFELNAEEKTYTSEGQKFKVENILQREAVIWGFDFLILRPS